MSDASTVTIVPFFNRRHTIRATLASVESQTIPPDQLVLVDDGSTDGGADLVAEWLASTPPLRHKCRFVRQPNRGAAAARNYGLSLAAPSRYVAFLDSDDIWPTDFLERTQAALRADRDAVAATCDQHYLYADGRPSLFVEGAPLAVEPRLWMMRFGAGIASATLFRRSHVARRGGFPALACGEDATLFLRLSLDGSWRYAPGEPVVFNRGLGQFFGDEQNLSEKFIDIAATLAQIYEQFVLQEATPDLRRTIACRRSLASAWFYAGAQLYQAAQPRRALTCFRRASSWRPGRFKYYPWIIRALFATVRCSTNGVLFLSRKRAEQVC